MTTTSKEDTIAQIVNLIPKGKDHAVTRSALRFATDMSDRKVRQAIHDARVAGHLIVSTDKGYYIPDDVRDLIKFYRQEKKRLASTYAGVRNIRAQLKEMGVEV